MRQNFFYYIPAHYFIPDENVGSHDSGCAQFIYPGTAGTVVVGKIAEFFFLFAEFFIILQHGIAAGDVCSAFSYGLVHDFAHVWSVPVVSIAEHDVFSGSGADAHSSGVLLTWNV